MDIAINSAYSYLQRLVDEVDQAIACDQIESALGTILVFVQRTRQEVRLTANVFGLRELDQRCQTVGQLIFNRYTNSESRSDEPDQPLNLGAEKIVYIATELYRLGGHTAVIEDFIRAQPDCAHTLVITNTFGTADVAAIEERFENLPVDFAWISGDSLQDKVANLQQYLLKACPQQTYLFIHHEDVVAIAATIPSVVPQVRFYHHCDHQLTLGLYLDHAQHIDPHPFGYQNCRDYLGVRHVHYIPLVVVDQGVRSQDHFLQEGTLTTASSGSPHKFLEPYPFSYFEMVPRIMAITGGRHVHIGPLDSDVIEELHKAAARLNIPQDRFVHVPWVQSLWQAMADYAVDLYLTSFPQGGGKASIEVMGSGTPMASHVHISSSLLSGAGLVYPQAFFWQEPATLYRYLSNLDLSQLRHQAVLARQHYERFFDFNRLNQSLAALSQLASADIDTVPEWVAIAPVAEDLSARISNATNQPDRGKQLSVLLETNRGYLDWCRQDVAYLMLDLAENLHQQKIAISQQQTLQLELQVQNQGLKAEIQAQREELQAQREELQAQREELQAQREELQARLATSRYEAKLLREKIEWMESSKFWKLREKYLHLKKWINPKNS